MDFGNVAEVDTRTDLLPIPAELHSCAVLAYPAQLQFVRPIGGGEWTEQALSITNELLLEQDLLAVVLSGPDSTSTQLGEQPQPYSVLLYPAQTQQDPLLRESFNEQLARMGLAAPLTKAEIETIQNSLPYIECKPVTSLPLSDTNFVAITAMGEDFEEEEVHGE